MEDKDELQNVEKKVEEEPEAPDGEALTVAVSVAAARVNELAESENLSKFDWNQMYPAIRDLVKAGLAYIDFFSQMEDPSYDQAITQTKELLATALSYDLRYRSAIGEDDLTHEQAMVIARNYVPGKNNIDGGLVADGQPEVPVEVQPDDIINEPINEVDEEEE